MVQEEAEIGCGVRRSERLKSTRAFWTRRCTGAWAWKAAVSVHRLWKAWAAWARPGGEACGAARAAANFCLARDAASRASPTFPARE